MSRFLWLANEWLQSWQQTGHGVQRNRRPGLSAKTTRRDRSQKRLTMESMEDRVLLSKADLTALVTAREHRACSGEPRDERRGRAPRWPRCACSPDLEEPDGDRRRSRGGVKGGTATLTAYPDLQRPPAGRPGHPLPDQGACRWQGGHQRAGCRDPAERQLEGSQGRAPMATGVVATFNGNSTHAKTTRSRSADGQPHCEHAERRLRAAAFSAAAPSSRPRSAPVGNRSRVSRSASRLNGQNVGSATTNAQGVASLTYVSLTGGERRHLSRRRHRELTRQEE